MTNPLSLSKSETKITPIPTIGGITPIITPLSTKS